jgi:hypothetical protein
MSGSWREIEAEHRRIEQVFKDHGIHDVWLRLSCASVADALQAAYQDGLDDGDSEIYCQCPDSCGRHG